MAHPVGTGPYRLRAWRHSSRILLEQNPDYRDARYQSEPGPDDAEGQAWAKRFNGRRLPLNDGVEIAIVQENQPRWLSFLNGEADFARVPPELSPLAAPNGKLAPNLARQGIRLQRYLNPDVAMSYFNMEDPVVGGYAPAKVALRRAIHLAYDIDYEVRLIRRGQAIPAQAPMAPGTYGFDPALRSDNSRYDVARAKALLDIYGYVDRDGDGWREQPDGSPLVLTMASETEQIYRQYNENWQRSTAAIGIRMNFETAQWAEHMKQARAGTLQMWFLGSTATEPDGQRALRIHVRRIERPGQPGALQAAGIRCDLPPHARPPRRTGAPRSLPKGERAGRRLHAVPHPRAPHLQRLLASVDRRLSTAVLPQSELALHRGRRRAMRAKSLA